MYLWRVFLVRPVAALSVLICLATIYWCWYLLKKRANLTLDRFLIGFLGLLSIYQGMRVLEACGLVALPASAHVTDTIELIVTAFYLVAILILRLAGHDRVTANLQLRLAQAAPPKSSTLESPGAELEREDRTVHQLAWALPRLSDGAFKLYVFLWLRAAHSAGRASVNIDELLSVCGTSHAGLSDCIGELEHIGADIQFRPGNTAEVKLSALPPQIGPLATTVATS